MRACLLLLCLYVEFLSADDTLRWGGCRTHLYYCASEDVCKYTWQSCTLSLYIGLYGCDGAVKTLEECKELPSFGTGEQFPNRIHPRRINVTDVDREAGLYVLTSALFRGVNIAVNASAIVMRVRENDLVPHTEHVHLLRFLFSNFGQTARYMGTVAPLVNRALWAGADPMPDAQVDELLVRIKCSDDLGHIEDHTAPHSECERLRPYGCDKALPKAEVALIQKFGHKTIINTVCQATCDMCPASMRPPVVDVCKETAEVERCVHLIATQVWCRDGVLEDYATYRVRRGGEVVVHPSVCYGVRYCPVVKAAAADACNTGNIYKTHQANTTHAFCVDEATGHPVAFAAVPLAAANKLTCWTPLPEDASGVFPCVQQPVPVWIRLYLKKVPLCDVLQGFVQNELVTIIASVAFVVQLRDVPQAMFLNITDRLQRNMSFADVRWSRDTSTSITVNPKLQSVSNSVKELQKENKFRGHATNVFSDLGSASALIGMHIERTLFDVFATENITYTTRTITYHDAVSISNKVDAGDFHVEIPGKVSVSLQHTFSSETLGVALHPDFEAAQPDTGYRWGFYEPRMDGTCPTPDENVVDPFGLGMQTVCRVRLDNNEVCRGGDLNRRHGPLRHNTTFFGPSFSHAGWSAFLGKILVVSSDAGVHCAAVTRTPSNKPPQFKQLIANFSSPDSQNAPGEEISGSAHLNQEEVAKEAVLSLTLRAGRALHDVKLHISTRRIADYVNGCTAAGGYNAATDLFDPLRMTRGAQPRLPEEVCLKKGRTTGPFDRNCPTGDLTARFGGHIPAAGGEHEAFYTFTVAQPTLELSALRPIDLPGGHTLVVLSGDRVLACAPLLMEGEVAEVRAVEQHTPGGFSTVALVIVAVSTVVILVSIVSCVCKGVRDVVYVK